MSRFKVLNTIGLGGQAYVKEAIDLVSSEPVALKIFNKQHMSLFALNAAHREYKIMKKVQHENITQVKGFFEDTEYIIIVLELMTSDLRQLLVDCDEPLDEAEVKRFFHQMLTSIEYCH